MRFQLHPGFQKIFEQNCQNFVARKRGKVFPSGRISWVAKAARSGDWDKAMANLRPYPSFVPRANVLDAFVEALIKEGRPAQAYDILKEHGGQSLGGAAKARPLNLAFWSRKG